MSNRFAQLAFTPAVRHHQKVHGSDRAYLRMAAGPEERDRIGVDEAAFIAQRDSFYLSTVSETGWPYIQHRGGPRGFLRVLDEHTLGFADLRGNRQYITRGNLDHDGRVALFLMDYAHQARLKILGRARVVEDDPATLAALAVEGYRGRPERALLIDVEGFDWNCNQHIPQLLPRRDVEEALVTLHDRIAELERENAGLRAGPDELADEAHKNAEEKAAG
ncbi:pyridoxamine 5'-phosphate oxidase family protein [Streptomyces sp. TRM66268-LWL]|uniref:Pyridoxamine 5'-phosphate oxidase family protein n=1 Tax=Streptomyces polyasparticus TaxID=2767826 RepID=A0ABR7SV54_9ACTN|nr:pyridoxamine 5'-phosphate oxidase family protein [Streptomyces polyasparticus]MBC9719356.1 pyridoxamine 5'-phosphate oxidase family protein [Streptomyces polyasparticus]